MTTFIFTRQFSCLSQFLSVSSVSIVNHLVDIHGVENKLNMFYIKSNVSFVSFLYNHGNLSLLISAYLIVTFKKKQHKRPIEVAIAAEAARFIQTI